MVVSVEVVLVVVVVVTVACVVVACEFVVVSVCLFLLEQPRRIKLRATVDKSCFFMSNLPFLIKYSVSQSKTLGHNFLEIIDFFKSERLKANFLRMMRKTVKKLAFCQKNGILFVNKFNHWRFVRCQNGKQNFKKKGTHLTMFY